jgi:small subunit ribosomal protein S17
MITKKGTITSAKMTNTVTVTVHRHMVHPVYKKSFRMSKKFLADTNGMDLFLGDEVMIQECRPMSKRKHFKVTQVIKAAARVSEMSEEKAVTEAIGGKNDETDTPSAS